MDKEMIDHNPRKIPYEEYTREDHDALEKKVENPELEVICPRCGGKIFYREGDSFYDAKCETPGCLRAIGRGI
jgi:hypothetical protein